MTDTPRLIEVAFPLKQASLDSVHEKNVRHGHISTLHIWPARRPLAASRAALIATLLPDPGNAEARRALLKRLGGEVQQVIKKKKLPNGKIEEKLVDETVGGVLHWGRESSEDVQWFRDEIRKAYGGRAPKVLDPFAGGGAIPLEAMRLGCDVTAMDINPVAWFILKCTLEYPQKLAGQTCPLPQFALDSSEFMRAYLKGTGKKTRKQLDAALQEVQLGLFPPPEADLAWQVRAWGWWVLQQARADLEKFYPVVDDKPTVAYLWARTVTCKHCRATLPLLKTRWLCKKDNKRVILGMSVADDGRRTTDGGKPIPKRVVFKIEADVPKGKGKDADKKLGAGTMSKSGATCPCCNAIMTTEDIRLEGQAGRLGAMMTAVVVDGQKGKEYRQPTEDEIRLASEAELELDHVFAEIPFGLPTEPLPSKEALGFRVPLYGFDQWYKLFTPRQLLAIGTFVKWTRSAKTEMERHSYNSDWVEAISASLALVIDKLADYISQLCTWHVTGEKMSHVFVRFALPINWDYAELNPLSNSSGNYDGCLDWVARVIEHATKATKRELTSPIVRQASAIKADSQIDESLDVVVTDPPYYDAIPYSDLMDFFYVWLRRTLHGLSPEIDAVFSRTLSPKWDHKADDGELIDDASRHGGDAARSKATYERGMARAFQACHAALKPDGRLVIVFAHKQPDAWETLVSAIIRAGFVVDGSWPIQTEMGNRTRALSSAALSSSVWLVCKKRPETARPGWDNQVLAEMRQKIGDRLRAFWDAGIRGPDFVWAATGPALEAYSRYPAVKKANSPTGERMSVSEFLGHVRRMVVDFVVGRVLSRPATGDDDSARPSPLPSPRGGEGDVGSLDEVTTYYLLHRNDFGMAEAPIGACILYAVSCGLSDRALADQYDLLATSHADQAAEADNEPPEGEEDSDAEAEPEVESSGGSTARLKAWQQRKRKGMGHDAPNGKPIPLIDQIHRLMHLWKAGDVVKVDDYLNEHGLRRNALFGQVLQSLIELSQSDERALLESISNHVAARGSRPDRQQAELSYDM